MDANGSGLEGKERRLHPRSRIHISIEVRTSEAAQPLRLATDDLSLGGCYIETMFPLDVGAKVFLTLWLKEERLLTKAVVATRYPQLGNGFHFLDMSLVD